MTRTEGALPAPGRPRARRRRGRAVTAAERAAELERILADEARRVSTLRTQMLEAHPFWGYLLLQLKLVPAPGLCSFAATDCVHHVWYNPCLTRHLPNESLGFVLVHEVCHQVLASENRRHGRNHHLWNCATDYAINRIVGEIRRPGRSYETLYYWPTTELPGLGAVAILSDTRFDGMIAESIYEHLAARDAGGSPRTVKVVLPGGHGGALRPRLPGGGEPPEATPGAGPAGDLELPEVLDHGGGIDVHLPDLMGDRDRQEVRERIAGAVETWRRLGGRGHVPEEYVCTAEVGRARVPWQRVLRRYVGEALAADDYALTRPNRRLLLEDIVVPGLYSERMGRVVVALDTSASMGPEELAAVASEIRAIARETEEATLIVADARVQEVVDASEIEAYVEKGRFRGGGGTDHRPVFEHIRRAGLAPDVFIGLTDLCTQFPERPPPYPVIWVAPRHHGPAPWGRVVTVDAD